MRAIGLLDKEKLPRYTVGEFLRGGMRKWLAQGISGPDLRPNIFADRDYCV